MFIPRTGSADGNAPSYRCRRLSEIFGEKPQTDQFLRTPSLQGRFQSLGTLKSASQRMLNLMLQESTVGLLKDMYFGIRIDGFEPKPWNPIDSLVWAKMMSWDLGAIMAKNC